MDCAAPDEALLTKLQAEAAELPADGADRIRMEKASDLLRVAVNRVVPQQTGRGWASTAWHGLGSIVGTMLDMFKVPSPAPHRRPFC